MDARTIAEGRTATSHVGDVHRILPLPVLTDAMIDELITDLSSFAWGEREAVLETVQNDMR